MKSAFDRAVRDELLARLDRLMPDAPARWGSFTATRMLAHLNDAMRLAVGELDVRVRRTILANPVCRWVAIYVIPWPKGARTARELLERGRGDVTFAVEQAMLRDLMGKFAARRGAPSWPPHPLFGAMREQDWGALTWRHTDHHFRQFGV